MDPHSADGPGPRHAPDPPGDPAGVKRPIAAAPANGETPARRPDSRLSDDGQLVEAGYGHGV
jgi:hypothetical protein